MADLDSATQVSMNKCKGSEILEKDFPAASDVIEKVTPNAKSRLEALQKIQIEHNEIKADFLKKKLDLEAKFQKKYEPLYTEMFNIVNGVKDDKGAEVEKGVPYFWLIAMKSNEVLANKIVERDEDPLKYLKHIKWSRIDSAGGFELSFCFGENPYFSNGDDENGDVVLTKTYHMTNDDDGEPVLEKVVGTEIKWNSYWKNVTVVEYPDGSNSYVQSRSFFNFFESPLNPEEEEPDKKVLRKVDDDFHIGCTIRDKIIPHAVSWFTGEYYEDDDMKQPSNL